VFFIEEIIKEGDMGLVVGEQSATLWMMEHEFNRLVVLPRTTAFNPEASGF
jgi:hypothetical protein